MPMFIRHMQDVPAAVADATRVTPYRQCTFFVMAQGLETVLL
jgi:hypothetical protein